MPVSEVLKNKSNHKRNRERKKISKGEKTAPANHGVKNSNKAEELLIVPYEKVRGQNSCWGIKTMTTRS